MKEMTRRDMTLAYLFPHAVAQAAEFERIFARLEAVMRAATPSLSRLFLALEVPHHPRPLCIDGHAYHRRRRARSMRNR
jgi:hypothetical protein